MSNETDRQTAAFALVERLLEAFRWERVTYLSVNVLALLLLFGAGVFIVILNFRNGPALAGALVTLFGSSGLITISVSRLLTMWTTATTLIITLTTGSQK